MTVRELKELLSHFDDNLTVVVKNGNDEFDDINNAYEDEEQYCTATDYAEAIHNLAKIKWRIRRVVKLF